MKKLLFILSLIVICIKNYASPIIIPNAIKPYTSIAIKRVSDGMDIYSLNPDTKRLIASNMKLFTGYFALNELKPDFRWVTKLYYTGEIIRGVLEGNLYIVGGGDPSLDEKGLYEILTSLKTYGIDKIYGNVVIDNSIFNQSSAYSMLHSSPYDTDTILPSGLMINQELTQVFIGVDKKTVTLNSDLYGFKLVNNLQVSTKNTPCVGLLGKIKVTKLNDQITLSGKIPPSCNNKILSYKFLSNFAYNRMMIYKTLDNLSIKIVGDLVNNKQYIANATLMYQYYSPSLEEVLINMMKYSNNLDAETLVLTVGAYNTTNRFTYNQGTKKFRQFLRKYNLVETPHIENGAGLSRNELFSANDLIRLLLHIARSNYYSDIMTSLPNPGNDGTLKNRFVEYTNSLYAKTGTLSDVVALSGYFKSQSNTVYAFSFLFNNVDDMPKEYSTRLDHIIRNTLSTLK